MESERSAEQNHPTPSPSREVLAQHMPLVLRIVAHFMRRLPRSVQREDLVAAGTIGLFHALRSSTHTCPEMFASYARIRIRGSIVDELRRHDWSPRRRRETKSQAPEEATKTTGTMGTVTDISAKRAQSQDSETDEKKPRIAVIGFDDLPPHLSLIEDDASPLDDIMERREFEAVHGAVEALPPRERSIIKMRYFEGMPSKAIARALGLSEARISQLHARATSRLREILDESEAIGLAA